MATQGTTNEGLDLIGDRYLITATDLILVAYTNTADSLGPTSVLATLTQPTVSNGYAPITLDGTWTKTDGVMTYLHSSVLTTANTALTGWEATGTWSATVTGVALVTATTLQHFMDLSTPFIAANLKKLGIDLQTVL